MDNVTLLQLYKQEKAEQEFPSSPFPPFKEWKAEYMIEYNDAHSDSQMVDVETAVEMTEKELEEADKKSVVTTTVKPEKVKKVVAITKPKSETKTETKVKKVSKKDQAVAIYKSMMVNGEHPARKDVIARFISEVNMSSAGASTYQFNIKKELS